MPLEIMAVCALATWRLSVALYMENGPWHVFDKLRYRAGAYLSVPESFWGKQLSCFWCISVWCGLLCGIAGFAWWPILLPLALSGAAMLLSGGGRIVWREMMDDSS
jgi:hypothetical protein